jgi:alpha-mannosidase
MENAHRVFPERFPDRNIKFNRICPTHIEHQKTINGQIYSSISTRTSLSNISRADRKVILYNNLKRIDFILDLDKRETRSAEAVYVAFPFAIDDFRIEMENAYSFLMPEEGQMPNTCRDWYLVQKWIRLFNNDFSIFWSPIEAPLVQLSEIQTGRWLHNLKLEKSTIYSWLFNNYWWTNIPASQGGWNYKFRYSLSSSDGNPDRVKAFQFGWNHHSPLMSWFVADENNGKLPEDKFNFFEIDKDNIVVTSIKKAEDGDGFIMRLFEIKGKHTQAKLRWNLKKVYGAFATDFSEKNLSKLDLENNVILINMRPFGITTIRILFK